MWQDGEPHGVGDFRDTTLDAVRAVVSELANVELVQGVFPASAAGLKDLRFAFVHLDLDWYRSTRDALEWLLPRMSAGGAIVLDDYGWKHCPGVKQAIEEFELEVRQTVPFQVVHWVVR
jgi:O-methyltransferase